jgi:hypothetical protein
LGVEGALLDDVRTGLAGSGGGGGVRIAALRSSGGGVALRPCEDGTGSLLSKAWLPEPLLVVTEGKLGGAELNDEPILGGAAGNGTESQLSSRLMSESGGGGRVVGRLSSSSE